MRARRTLLWLLGVVVLATTCGSAASKPPPSALGPKEVAARYFAAVSKGEWATAHGCLEPAYDRLLSSAPDSDFNNLDSITDVQVGDPHPAGHPGGSDSFADTAEVAVTFQARYKQTITVDSGRQTRFVLLGRHGPGEPWLIFGIGTGP
jgi:hypothetical protein